MNKRFLTSLMILFLFTAIAVFALYSIRPPGAPLPYTPKKDDAAPLQVKSGRLPGITWQDDIHPIFLRNRCGECHTRGKEAVVDRLKHFALGLIDPESPENPYFSYHELVYAEGQPLIMKGERLRDGQCCWPRNDPAHQQRRIWIGHPEKSALIRKLDRDYYDSNRPPRFLEEGLDLLWGMPMPMFHEELHSHDENPTEDHHDEIDDDHHHDDGHDMKAKESVPEVKEKSSHQYRVKSFPERMLFHFSLWLGGSRGHLYSLPPKIPESDRDLLRQWIGQAMQLKEDGTTIDVTVLGPEGKPVRNAEVSFIGNYTSPSRREVTDFIEIVTGDEGKAMLSFEKHGVITSQWYISAKKGTTEIEDYEKIVVREGEKISVKLEL